MNRKTLLALAGILAITPTFGCRAPSEVHAGFEGDYQPRPAPPAPVKPEPAGRKIAGELIKVDVEDGLITVRAENGMEQTFKLDKMTIVSGPVGPDSKDIPAPSSQKGVKTLSRRIGEIVLVEFEDPTGPKLATSVEIK